ncbi:UNVERIFIED_CONTAM: hypothetical protein Sradi_4466300 [Sesamum radiatum]|uniref:DUF4283 domain-containing protein n=1 Tax=Sesamum radiatum TaxID=300843 RepID=A0AAW2N6P9_SESRA
MLNSKHVLIFLTKESNFSHLWPRRIWYLQGYPMRIFKWSRTFNHSHESSIVPIWMCFPELPAHLFCKKALSAVASMNGTPLQMDNYTFNKSKPPQARVCIEIDLLQPPMEEFDLQINGTLIRQKVVFEKIPPYCTLCKHVGHLNSACYSKGNAPKPAPQSRRKGKEPMWIDEHLVLKNVEQTKPFNRYPADHPDNIIQCVAVDNSRNVNVKVVSIAENEIAHAENDASMAVNESLSGIMDEETPFDAENEANGAVNDVTNHDAACDCGNDGERLETIDRDKTKRDLVVRNPTKDRSKKLRRIKIKDAIRIFQILYVYNFCT